MSEINESLENICVICGLQPGNVLHEHCDACKGTGCVQSKDFCPCCGPDHVTCENCNGTGLKEAIK